MPPFIKKLMKINLHCKSFDWFLYDKNIFGLKWVYTFLPRFFKTICDVSKTRSKFRDKKTPFFVTFKLKSEENNNIEQNSIKK